MVTVQDPCSHKKPNAKTKASCATRKAKQKQSHAVVAKRKTSCIVEDKGTKTAAEEEDEKNSGAVVDEGSEVKDKGKKSGGVVQKQQKIGTWHGERMKEVH